MASFLILWGISPENIAPFVITPLLLGGETGLKYRSVSMGIQSKVNPYFERGLSYKIGPISSLVVGRAQISADLAFEFNNFNRNAMEYSQCRLGLSIGLMPLRAMANKPKNA